MTKELETQLENTFLNLELEPRNIELFIEYINTLRKWNRKINLISKKENDIVNSLIAPSLLFFKVTEGLNCSSVVDLGSGAGFPGFVIKIYEPDIKMFMIEKNSKKCAFLNYVNTILQLESQIISESLFDITSSKIEAADIVTVRGVRLTKNIIEEIKRKTKSKRLIYFTSQSIHLPLVLEKQMEFNYVVSKMYKL